MARIELAPGVLDDFDRFCDHLAGFAASDAAERIDDILQAIAILEHSPCIGRQVGGGKRELVIGKDARGHVALYRYVPEIDTVFVLAVRSQRESGFKR